MGQFHYYTPDSYATAGFIPFTRHVYQSIIDGIPIPVSRTNATSEHPVVIFTFSDTLLEVIYKDEKRMKKPYEVALKFGFRGFSKGGRNGIFYVRKSDKGLQRKIPKLIKRDKQAIVSDCDIKNNGLDALANVKIVWHNPSGERIVGVYNENNQRMIFLDFAYY